MHRGWPTKISSHGCCVPSAGSGLPMPTPFVRKRASGHGNAAATCYCCACGASTSLCQHRVCFIVLCVLVYSPSRKSSGAIQAAHAHQIARTCNIANRGRSNCWRRPLATASRASKSTKCNTALLSCKLTHGATDPGWRLRVSKVKTHPFDWCQRRHSQPAPPWCRVSTAGSCRQEPWQHMPCRRGQKRTRRPATRSCDDCVTRADKCESIVVQHQAATMGHDPIGLLGAAILAAR